MSFDINQVDEITVHFSSESKLPPVKYRGKGLEKFRRLVLSSPQYGVVPVVIDDDSSFEKESPEIKPKTKKTPKHRPSANGYTHANLTYSDNTANKGKSAVDLAREMQRQAESAMGINFQ
ncbi:MAG TPA: hypothetical protein PKD85_04240 [Saprospiraceae bacterium]|nr:hypothetical protein [Saprospiraceae bacterium]